MSYAPFFELFPEVAQRETRAITLSPVNDASLPPDTYGFVEMFCDDKRCDCRRVMYRVFSDRLKAPVAVIAYGWGSRGFYIKWFGREDEDIIEEMTGPCLPPLSPQTELAPRLLALFKETLLPDADYMARVKRHYEMFRGKIDKPGRKSGKR